MIFLDVARLLLYYGLLVMAQRYKFCCETKNQRLKEGNIIYEVNIFVDCILSAVVSIGFFIYGWLLFFLTKNSEEAGFVTRERELIEILLITVIFTACFLTRSGLFLLRPVSGQKLPDPIFYSMAYYVSESIPSLLQIYISETSRGRQLQDSKFIDDLYAESQDSIEEYKENKLLKKQIDEEEGRRLVDS